MELSKEVYPKSPEKKDIQSVVNDLLQDEKIVGKKKKNEKKEKKEKNEKKEKKEKKENIEENPEEKKEENPEKNSEEKKEEKKEEKPIEKKRRGRPPKKNIQIEDKSESKLDVDVEVDVEVLPKKPRGRPRKIKLPSTPQHDTTHHDTTHHDTTHHHTTHHLPTHILPLIQSISSTHLLHTLPDKTLKYIIFLIHLSYHTPITQNTLHTLIHTSIHSFKHFSPLRTSFIKHQLLSASSAPSEPSDTSP